MHFLCCHYLELSRKLLAYYITCAHYCWLSSMIGKIGLAGARGGKHIPWEIPLFSGLLSMFDISMAELGRRRCTQWLFDTKLDIFPLFLYFLSLFLSVVQKSVQLFFSNISHFVKFSLLVMFLNLKCWQVLRRRPRHNRTCRDQTCYFGGGEGAGGWSTW